MKKTLSFSKHQIEKIAKIYPTPFHLYDEKAIRENARAFYKAFDWVEGGGFKNYFAVKVAPNPYLLQILQEEGMGVDCSSLPELILAEKVGFMNDDIIFSSNNTPLGELKKARELGAIINLDDISYIPFLEKEAGTPETICFRYNPGSARKYAGNVIIGRPEESKYGLTREQIFEAYKIMKEKGVKQFGLHTMVVSNELNKHAFVETAAMVFDLVQELSQKLSIRFSFVNLGGGIGIPYTLEQKPVDINFVSQEIKKLYQQKIVKNNLAPLQIAMESGRYITGPCGYLITRVIHKKDIYKKYVGVDASIANLMRPPLYGAYHHITVLGKEKEQNTYVYDVVGSLCENNDKLAIDRKLPRIDIGDILAIHDTGAHGHAMGFNYNGKLRSAELLLQENGEVKPIRRAETIDDYFATLDFSGLRREKQ